MLSLQNLRVEATKLLYIPRVVVDFSFFVGELVSAGTKDVGDDEGSLPGRRKLVAALVALSESQHQVADPEGATSESSSVVASESLLKLSRL